MTERLAFTRDVLLHRVGECPTCDAASADHHPALSAKTRTMQHRAGHCVICDAALMEHRERSIGPIDDSDRFGIGPPPVPGLPWWYVFPFHFPLTALVCMIVVFGGGLGWGLWTILPMMRLLSLAILVALGCGAAWWLWRLFRCCGRS